MSATGPVLDGFEHLIHHAARCVHGPALAPPSSGEREHLHAVGERVVDGLEVLDARHDVARVVRDLLQARLVVLHGAHEAQVETPMFFIARITTDVDGVLPPTATLSRIE
jgi:hypothetical protein